MKYSTYWRGRVGSDILSQLGVGSEIYQVGLVQKIDLWTTQSIQLRVYDPHYNTILAVITLISLCIPKSVL